MASRKRRKAIAAEAARRLEVECEMERQRALEELVRQSKVAAAQEKAQRRAEATKAAQARATAESARRARLPPEEQQRLKKRDERTSIAFGVGVLLVLGLVLWGCVSIYTTPDDSPPDTTDNPPAAQSAAVMPDVRCDSLRDADAALTSRGISADYQDATSEERTPFDYSNWVVVAQAPAAGQNAGDAPVLAVLKLGEGSGC